MHKNQSGFTLTEILVAITIVTITFVAVISAVSAIKQRSRDAQRRADLLNLKSALQQYYSDQNFFPSSTLNTPLNLVTTTSLTEAVGNPNSIASPKKYLQPMMIDPVSGTSTPYCYKAYGDSALNTPSCSNASGSECQYYLVCGHLEGAVSTSDSPSAQCQAQCGSSYNLQINP